MQTFLKDRRNVVGPALLLALATWVAAAAHAQSTWNSPTGGSWLDPAKWSGPVPNSPGAAAVLQRSPTATLGVTLPSTVALGRLTINGPSTFNLSGTGPLTFDEPGAEPARLQIGGTPRTHQFTVPIAIAGGENLAVEVISGATLSLRGGLTGDSVLTKTGAGSLELFAGNPAFSGQLVVNAGEVSLGNAASLGAGTGVAANGTRVNPGAVLRFNALIEPTQELIQLDGGAIVDRSFGVRGNTLGPVELLSTSAMRNSLGSSFEPTVLAGPISGPGGLNLQGDFTFSGDNTYAGETIIESSGNIRVSVNSPTGLGGAAAGTTVKANSELHLNAAGAEPLLLQGGRVRWNNNSQGWTGPVASADGLLVLAAPQTFSFPVTVQGSTTLHANNANAVWAGAVGGVGDLVVGGGLTIKGGLSHQGNLTINAAALDGANSYTGQTIIRGRTTVNHAQAFGVSDSAIVLDNSSATLMLNKSIERDILVKNGNVELRDATTPYTDVVHMQRGFLRWEGLPFVGTIALENADVPAEVVVHGGTFEGLITGEGKLVLDGGNGTLNINRDNDYRGHTVVYGRVELNAVDGFGDAAEGAIIGSGTTSIRVPTSEPLMVHSQGRLELYSPLPRLPHTGSGSGGSGGTIDIRVPSTYSQPVELRQGTLQVSAPTTLASLTLHNEGTLLTEPGMLQLSSGHIEMQGGTIDGSIAGLNAIRKVGAGAATVRRMRNFHGEIELAGGTLTVDELWATGAQPAQASPNRGTIRVNARDAVLNGAGHVVDADVHLNNARGAGFYAGLNSMVLLGDLYLGDQGASLAGSGTGVYLRGAIYGGDLIFPDDQSHSEVQITSDRAAYTGETLIRDGYLNLADRGKLTTTSRVVIGRDGQLLLNNSRSETGPGLPNIEHDRVADHIPLLMQGGELRLWSPSEATATERIGRIELERGSAKITGQPGAFSPATGTTRLTIDQLQRSEGATLLFDREYPMAVEFDQPPALTNGMIGPWATYNRVHQGRLTTDFATYGPGGVQALTAFQQNLAVATAVDNVLVAQDSSLPARPVTVNSLTIRSENDVTLNLAGQRLTVASGGVLTGGTIVNGELAPGATKELILTPNAHRTFSEIFADIVDGAAGPTTLTAASGKFNVQYELGGSNTYTGLTRVNNDAALVFRTFDSLPSGNDIEVNGGDVRLGYESTEIKSLGSLRVRDNGRFTLQHPGSARVDFEQIELESGSLEELRLVGDAPITKRGEGAATLSLDGRDFAGTVDVFDGDLIVEGSRSIGNRPVNVHGGRLVLQTMRNDSNLAPGDVYLNGGDLVLDNAYNGTVHVNAPARVSGASFSGFSRLAQPGTLVGASPVAFGGRIDLTQANNAFTGDVAIEGRVVARHTAGFGSGAVTLMPGSLLEMAFPDGGDLSNDLVLAGGELSTDNEVAFTPFPGRVLGSIDVTADSTIATNFRDPIEIAGPLSLGDGVRLTKREEGLLTISGDILVGGDAELALGPGFMRHNDGTVIRDVVSEVSVTGVIKSAAEHARLNFVRSGFDKFLLAASIHVEPGQTLTLLEDNVPLEFSVAPGATISGNGVFANPVRIDGGTIAPGQSPGKLTFASDLTIGANTVFQWEINDAAGVAGGSLGWDFLQVAQQLVLDADPANPFVIEVTGLDAMNQPGAIANFDPLQTYRWQIAAAGEVVGFDPAAVRFAFSSSSKPLSVFRAENFSLALDGGGLFIEYQHVVPEPAAFALALAGLLGVAARRPHAGWLSSR